MAIQIGERTTVYVNGNVVMDHIRMPNTWNAKLPLLKKGPIQLGAMRHQQDRREHFVHPP